MLHGLCLLSLLGKDLHLCSLVMLVDRKHALFPGWSWRLGADMHRHPRPYTLTGDQAAGQLRPCEFLASADARTPCR